MVCAAIYVTKEKVEDGLGRKWYDPVIVLGV